MSYRVLVECKDVPESARRAFGIAARPNSAEESLWRDVAARMVLDACGYTNFSKADKGDYREHLKVMGEAHNWFRNDASEVEEVFDMANVDHEPVMRAILTLIQSGDLFHEA